MIRLQPHPCPPELTPEEAGRMTTEYQADTTKSVWNKDFIKTALLKMSHGKCCYCECKIDEESKYLEVEHFQPKSLYPLLVVFWENLLPSCKRCNGIKWNHDTVAEPIIHPVRDEPKDHIRFRAYRFYEKTPLGKKTIEVVDLNDRVRLKLMEKRFEIGEGIISELDVLEDMALDFQNNVNTSPKRQKLIVGKMKTILTEAQPEKEYAATAATVLIHEPLFTEVKNILLACHLWDDEMAGMENAARHIAFDIF